MVMWTVKVLVVGGIAASVGGKLARDRVQYVGFSSYKTAYPQHLVIIMPTTLVVPDGYGYTAIIALGLIPILSIIQGSVVVGLRKPAKIPYPNAYATPEQMKNSKEAYKFNCAQRSHANLHENLPQTIAALLFAGLFYPRATPLLGAGWVASRALYAYGYITSDKPNGNGRLIGASFWLAQLGIIGLCVTAALQML